MEASIHPPSHGGRARLARPREWRPMATKHDSPTLILTVLVALALLGVGFLVVEYVGPPPGRLPIPSGTRFYLSANQVVVLNFTVGPRPGTLVGAWTADGAVCFFPPPLNRGMGLRQSVCTSSGSVNESLAPGHWFLMLRPWLASRTVTVTDTIQVVYPARSARFHYGEMDMWRDRFPVPNGTTFGVGPPPVLSVLSNLTVGPGPGRFVGSWTATGPACASMANWTEPVPPLCDAFAQSGTFNMTLPALPAPGSYTLAFMQPYDAAAHVNVTVTETLRVVYGP